MTSIPFPSFNNPPPGPITYVPLTYTTQNANTFVAVPQEQHDIKYLLESINKYLNNISDLELISLLSETEVYRANHFKCALKELFKNKNIKLDINTSKYDLIEFNNKVFYRLFETHTIKYFITALLFGD